MFTWIEKVKKKIYPYIPRIYNCRDVWLIKWLNNEYIMRK